MAPTRTTKEFRISDPRTNDRIRVPEVRLVGPAGEQVGVVRIEDALRLAQEADLDLVEVAPDSKPPVVKIMDYGKFKYETAQKARESRKNQQQTVVKGLSDFIGTVRIASGCTILGNGEVCLILDVATLVEESAGRVMLQAQGA